MSKELCTIGNLHGFQILFNEELGFILHGTGFLSIICWHQPQETHFKMLVLMRTITDDNLTARWEEDPKMSGKVRFQEKEDKENQRNREASCSPVLMFQIADAIYVEAVPVAKLKAMFHLRCHLSGPCLHHSIFPCRIV